MPSNTSKKPYKFYISHWKRKRENKAKQSKDIEKEWLLISECDICKEKSKEESWRYDSKFAWSRNLEPFSLGFAWSWIELNIYIFWDTLEHVFFLVKKKHNLDNGPFGQEIGLIKIEHFF